MVTRKSPWPQRQAVEKCARFFQRENLYDFVQYRADEEGFDDEGRASDVLSIAELLVQVSICTNAAP